MNTDNTTNNNIDGDKDTISDYYGYNMGKDGKYTIGEIMTVDSLTRYEMQQTIDTEDVSLGRFVYVEERGIIGVIGDIRVNNPYAGQFPRPKNLPDDTRLDAIFPDLVEQFPTIVTIHVLGYTNGGKYVQDIPPRPPAIYDKISLADKDMIRQFHLSEDGQPLINYLIRLMWENNPVIDAMIKNIISQISAIFNIEVEEIMEVLTT